MARKLLRRRIVAQGEIERVWKTLARAAAGLDAVAPFETRDDRALEITIHRMTGEGEGAVVVVQDVTERRNAARAIDRMARVDSVTDLPNRRRFEEELAGTLRGRAEVRESANVLFLDLDDFKQVNDSLGHARGDKLLTAVARRLQGSCARPTSSRAGAATNSPSCSARSPIRARLASSPSRSCAKSVGRSFIDGYEVIVGASVGSASAPQDGETPEAILSNADMALYAAKADGRGNWRAFEKSMDAKIQIRRLVELDLRAAVANDAIEVHFQPIVEVATRQISGFEALARWNHPVRGRVSPAEFIPIVEELGLMNEFGASVLRRACVACADWPGDVSVSVNLSPSQFRSGRIVETVARGARLRGSPASRLDLEITESTLLDDRGSTPRDVGGVARPRRPHLARRLRHRLFELELRAEPSRSTGSRSTAPSPWASACRSAPRSWSKASRRCAASSG